MKLQQYSEIQKGINDTCINGEGNVTVVLVKKFPLIDKKTLGSIITQEIQRKVKKSFHRFNTPEKALEIFKRHMITTESTLGVHRPYIIRHSVPAPSYMARVEEGEAPGVVVRMAQEMDYSPAMLAKLVLEHHLKTTCPDIIINKSHINSLLRDTTLIDDRDLSYEVYLCLLDDDVYGPFADSIKHSIGQEYEFLLCQELDKLNIGYHAEDELRSRGYDKTPDIKLDIPIAVDGHVINWIESKASFGDEESHRSYLKDQFWSYWNR
ncbi:hypothetical protein GWK47_002757 [Chionoecetes opilio]|uniref:CDAN1-interacting nuclease 1 n=1 Tax=Chionoecetes opilio TaxID=41210 RepID=A0A8J4XV91_CHIOP|nr:hypothetical protein GWK47_002757 [Chionoecetes opilio]